MRYLRCTGQDVSGPADGESLVMHDPVADMCPVRPGELLAGRYRVERVLGVGGMGVVVAARHVQLDDLVAIKFLLPQALQSAEVVARFAREARAAVKIKNEHVARVLDVGTLETGAPYMIMEYLSGCDLGELIHTQGQIPILEAADYVLQACEAIAEAHSLGIVHRDLKPANLFLVTRPDGGYMVKVLDFGISKSIAMRGSGPSGSMTQTSSVLGSPLYMSPEQMASARDVDVRADIWALGVILHEILTGHAPFEADTMPQLCMKIVQEPPPPLRSVIPDAPIRLEEIIQKCLEKDRNRRFGNIAEFALALSEFAPPRSRISAERAVHLIRTSGGQINTTPVSDGRDGRTIVTTTGSNWGQATRPPTPQRGRAVAVLAGGLAVLLAIGITVLVLRRPKQAQSTDPPSNSTTAAAVEAESAKPPPNIPDPRAAENPAGHTAERLAPSQGWPADSTQDAGNANPWQYGRAPDDYGPRPSDRLPALPTVSLGARARPTSRGTKPTTPSTPVPAPTSKPETPQPTPTPAPPPDNNGWDQERR